MGCEQSRLSNSAPLPLSIADPHFFKASLQSARDALLSHHISVKPFMTVDHLLNALQEDYTNHVVIREEDLPVFSEKLKEAGLQPFVFVRSNQPKEASKKRAFFKDYEDLPALIQLSSTAKQPKKKVDVCLLVEAGSSDLLIFEETLKLQNLSYEIYHSFGELENSESESPLIVAEYRFHRAVIGLGLKAKVICLCRLGKQESYHPSIFFATDNFQEVVNEVTLFKRLAHGVLPISKLFLVSHPGLEAHAEVLEGFGLQVRKFKGIDEVIKVARLYFAVLVVCAESQKATIQERIKELGCSFRFRVLAINSETESSARGLRHILRESKRGYLVERGLPRAVDIIDRYHQGPKYAQLKKQLQSLGVAYRGYPSIIHYCKKFRYIAPIIITSHQERALVYQYLSQVQLKVKIAVYCNKGAVSDLLAHDNRWSIVSSHYQKIVRFIKGEKVVVPLSIIDQKVVQAKKAGAAVKSRQHRISAIKWAEQGKEEVQGFIIDKKDGKAEDGKTQGEMLQLGYQYQEKKKEEFLSNLKNSLKELSKQYQLGVTDLELEKIFSDFCKDSLDQIAARTMKFFGQQKEVGISINNSLYTLPKLSQVQISHLKQVVFLLCFNYLNVRSLQQSQLTTLCCWTKETAFQECQVNSSIASKGFLSMRDESSIEKIEGYTQLKLDLEYSPLKDENCLLSSYFVSEGRFIFAPYSRFVVTQVEAQNKNKVIHIKLDKRSKFVDEILGKGLGADIKNIIESDMKSQSPVLVDKEMKRRIEMTQLRVKALTLSNGSSQELSQAIAIQKKLITDEEECQNFDSSLLAELKFELAAYLSRNNLPDESLDLIEEIREFSPNSFIRRECSSLLSKLKTNYQRGGRSSKSVKCISLRQAIEKIEEQSEQQQPQLQENILYQGIFQCLELEEKEDSFEKLL